MGHPLLSAFVARVRRVACAALVPVATAAALLAACDRDTALVPATPDADAGADPRPPTPPEWDRAVMRPDEASASASRGSCKFARGALPEDQTFAR